MRTVYWNRILSRGQTRRFWQELEEFQALSPQLARRELGRRLLAQIHYFGSRADALAEWHEAASIRDPEDLWRIWTTLPVLSKQDLKTRFHPAQIKSCFNLKGVASSTGGATGEPTPFFHDEAMVQAKTAASIYCRWRIGWRPGMPTICIWGSERDIGEQRRLRGRISAYLLNFWLVDGYALDYRTVARVLKLIGRHSSVAVYGFTSMLEFVAREVLRRDCLPVTGRVRMAWNGGEMLFDNQSELFQEAFGVPILNFYGGRELSAIAYQPCVGSPLRVLRPLVFAEVVDEEGRPVQPGTTGRLILTSTVCRGTPFLRYDIGDVACYGSEDYDESGVSRIKELQGRQAGLLKLPDGRTISCLFWNHFFKDFPEVEQFQVALIQGQEIHLRLKGTRFTPRRENELQLKLGNFFGHIPIRTFWMDQIPLTRQGKLIQVVREDEASQMRT